MHYGGHPQPQIHELSPYGDLQQRVHHLGMGGGWREDTAAAKEYDGYIQTHQGYLGEVAQSLNEQVAKRGSGLVTEQFNPGDKTAFVFDGKAGTHLDLEALGLPRYDTPGHTSLALVVHEAPKGDKASTGAIEVLIREDATGDVRGRYLEDFGALDPSGERKPRWIGAGERELSTPQIETESQIVGNRQTGRSMQTVQSTKTYDGIKGQAQLIRPKPTSAERASGGHRREGFVKRHAKKLGTLAALSATLAVAPFVHTSKSPESDIDLKNPDQMVQQAGYNPNQRKDVRQAEEFFTKEPLNRSREAFAAYARGDKAALAAEAAKYEYQDNWIEPTTFEAVQKATSPQEIEAAFKKALDGLPVTLSFDASDIWLDSFTYTPSTSLEDQKKMTLGIMGVYNLLDKSSAQKNLHPIRYVLVASMKSKNDNGITDPAGLFVNDSNNERIPQVLLGTDYVDNAEEYAAHETAHDFSDTGVFGGSPKYMNGVISSLNPIDHVYTGYDNYSQSPTTIRGNKIAQDPYSNADDAEDLAKAAETILIDKPVIDAEESTFLEKQQAVLFEMEELFPGYTAAFLLRANVQYPATADNIENKTAEAIWSALETAQLPNAALASLILLALAAGEVRRRQETTDLRKYGVLPARAGGLVLKYSPYTQRYEPRQEDKKS